MILNANASVAATDSFSATPDAALTLKALDYSCYQFRAEVDWISLRLVTRRPTNFQTIRRRLGASRVDATAPTTGGASCEFIARFQDPVSWSDIDQRLKRLATDHPLAQPVVVDGVEIALDAYSRSQSREELVAIAAHFFRGMTKLVSVKRYARRAGQDKHPIERQRDLQLLFDAGYNVYIGGKFLPEYQHIYIKETDSSVALPLAEHRARTEFTLTGSEVPEPMFEAWRDYRFTGFADYFKFRRLKAKLPRFFVKAHELLPQIGERRPRKTKHGNYRQFSKNTVADVELNKKAYEALRELTERWSK